VRRVVGVVAGAALVLALSAAVGRTSDLPQGMHRFDFGAALMLRLFGETSDSSASFAAANGDRTSESPLRELALQVRPANFKPYTVTGAPAGFGEDRLTLRDLSGVAAVSFAGAASFDAGPSIVRFTAPSAPAGDSLALAQSGARFTAAYQPVPPEPAISPAPGTLAFAPPEMHALDFIPSSAQIGAVRFEGHAEGGATQTPQLALRDASYVAGANFDVRAGQRTVNVDLSSQYEQVGRNDAGSFAVSSLDSSSSWQLPQTGAPLLVPNDANLNRLSLGAGLSVPVVRGLTLNLDYGAQRLYGGYGLPGLVNLDAVNNSYGGKLTFTIPQISSSLSIGAYQDRFQDSFLPLNEQSQTREDVNFTVKF
jgi:hypothetical protein